MPTKGMIEDDQSNWVSTTTTTWTGPTLKSTSFVDLARVPLSETKSGGAFCILLASKDDYFLASLVNNDNPFTVEGSIQMHLYLRQTVVQHHMCSLHGMLITKIADLTDQIKECREFISHPFLLVSLTG